MVKRSAYIVRADGRDITGIISPSLTALSVSLQSGGGSDSAKITINDTGAVAFPEREVDLDIYIGWGSAVLVFEGHVDGVTSASSRSGGATISISGRGFDGSGKSQEGQRRHWDDATVKTILEEAGALAGVREVKVAPSLAGVVIDYWSMNSESYLAMGQRLAEEIGGHFRIRGRTAVMAKRGEEYSPVITAARGVNLHGWSMTPRVADRLYSKVRCHWFDRAANELKHVEKETQIPDCDGTFVVRPNATDEAEATRRVDSAIETIRRDAGGGSLTIEGEPGAIPDGRCIVSGARAGINGTWRILRVNHTLSRSGGFVSSIEVGLPPIA